MKRSYQSIIFITLLWVASVLIVISMSSCSTPAPTSSREVIFRAKVLTYSYAVHDFIPSTPVYLVTVDSAYRPSDTVIWNNERYVLLNRSK